MTELSSLGTVPIALIFDRALSSLGTVPIALIFDRAQFRHCVVVEKHTAPPDRDDVAHLCGLAIDETKVLADEQLKIRRVWKFRQPMSYVWKVGQSVRLGEY